MTFAIKLKISHLKNHLQKAIITYNMIYKIKSEQILTARKLWLQVAKRHKMVYILYMIDNAIKVRDKFRQHGRTEDTHEPMFGLDQKMSMLDTDKDITAFLNEWKGYLIHKKLTFKESLNRRV